MDFAIAFFSPFNRFITQAKTLGTQGFAPLQEYI
jgi:hypothetical protein